jgi:hypothetical protein
VQPERVARNTAGLVRDDTDSDSSQSADYASAAASAAAPATASARTDAPATSTRKRTRKTISETTDEADEAARANAKAARANAEAARANADVSIAKLAKRARDDDMTLLGDVTQAMVGAVVRSAGSGDVSGLVAVTVREIAQAYLRK